MSGPFNGRWVVHVVLVASGVTVMAAQAASQGGQPAPGNQPRFTGTSTAMDGKDLSVARRRFEPGARSYWHSHDNGQLLYVEQGRMRTQKRKPLSIGMKRTLPKSRLTAPPATVPPVSLILSVRMDLKLLKWTPTPLSAQLSPAKPATTMPLWHWIRSSSPLVWK